MKVRLTALTPLHIGGRESALNPLEFVLFAGCCYVVSERRLVTVLHEHSKIDVFSAWCSGRDRPVLHDFLREQGLLKAAILKRIAAYSSAAPPRIERSLRPCVRDAFARPFLPGTGLKGAMRTAFLYKILKDLRPEQRKKILDDFVTARLQEYKRDPRAQRGFRWFQDQFKQWFAEKIETDIFQRFSLQENQRHRGPHTDLFRCLRVTDSSPLDPEQARVEEIKIFSARSADSPKRFSLFIECVPAGSVFEWELSIDEITLAEFSKKNKQTWFGADFATLEEMVRDPLRAWAEMGHDLWQQEARFFAREFGFSTAVPDPKGRPVVRVGWGAGLLGTSVDMLLPDSLRQELRNTLFTDRGSAPAPKSRRLAIQGNNTLTPLGWATVERVG